MAKEEQFLKIIKQAALDAVQNSSPCDFCIGVVVSESPLSIPKIDAYRGIFTFDKKCHRLHHYYGCRPYYRARNGR